VCDYCSQPFPQGRFASAPDGNLYCEKDFHELFARRCHTCKDIIKGICVNAGNNIFFHPQHFSCVLCATNLQGKGFKIKEETKDPYCSVCIGKHKEEIENEEKICARCKLLIKGAYIKLHGQFIHAEHYKCTECRCELSGSDSFEYDAQLYCRVHYEMILRKSCGFCNKPIVGRSVTALGQVWHPEHFTCHICNESLDDRQYYEEGGKAYCEEHYIQLFGTMCVSCAQPVNTTGGIAFLDKKYHQHCFKCSKCDKVLKDGNFTDWDSQPMCLSCYDNLPKKVKKMVEKRKRGEKKAEKDREKEDKKKSKQQT
jgi:paxillin